MKENPENRRINKSGETKSKMRMKARSHEKNKKISPKKNYLRNDGGWREREVKIKKYSFLLKRIKKQL